MLQYDIKTKETITTKFQLFVYHIKSLAVQCLDIFLHLYHGVGFMGSYSYQYTTKSAIFKG